MLAGSLVEDGLEGSLSVVVLGKLDLLHSGSVLQTHVPGEAAWPSSTMRSNHKDEVAQHGFSLDSTS